MQLSILIKTLNEEKRIARCLACARAATRNVAGGVEIIVADSLSSDQTVRIARDAGASVVQLKNAADRGCGAAVQLGFQHSTGRFVYILDADMELQQGFIEQALTLLEENERLAGVAGILQDSEARNWFDRKRKGAPVPSHAVAANYLNGGGLYRRKAVEDAGGYAGNRNLKAFEEAELGFRLCSRGWSLVRIPVLSVLHTGHAESTCHLIGRYWRGGRMLSTGILLKAAVGQPWLPRALRLFIHPFAVLLYWGIWLALLLGRSGALWIAALALLGATAVTILIIRKRSVGDAFFSILLWHLTALGLIRGLTLHGLPAPTEPISSTVYSRLTEAEDDRVARNEIVSNGGAR